MTSKQNQTKQQELTKRSESGAFSIKCNNCGSHAVKLGMNTYYCVVMLECAGCGNDAEYDTDLDAITSGW